MDEARTFIYNSSFFGNTAVPIVYLVTGKQECARMHACACAFLLVSACNRENNACTYTGAHKSVKISQIMMKA